MCHQGFVSFFLQDFCKVQRGCVRLGFELGPGSDSQGSDGLRYLGVSQKLGAFLLWGFLILGILLHVFDGGLQDARTTKMAPKRSFPHGVLPYYQISKSFLLILTLRRQWVFLGVSGNLVILRGLKNKTSESGGAPQTLNLKPHTDLIGLPRLMRRMEPIYWYARTGRADRRRLDL